jgi:PPP family 3-phenylpropionic acid transporter
MALSPTVAALFAIQLLHGLSIMAPILGMMLYIERRVAPHLIASAQGLYAPTWNGLMGLCTAACGPIDKLLGSNAYLVMAAVAAAGGAVAYGALQERPGNLKGAAGEAH